MNFTSSTPRAPQSNSGILPWKTRTHSPLTKILVFSNVEEAQKLRAKNNSKIDAIEKQSRKREFRKVTQFAREILKDTFSKSDEESDDLLGSGDEDLGLLVHQVEGQQHKDPQKGGKPEHCSACSVICTFK